MKIRSMIAAALRPWFSVQSNATSVKIVVGNSGRGKPHVGFVIKDYWSGNGASSLWLGSHWFQVGDLWIGVGHSEPWRRMPTVEEKPANDSRAA